MHKSISTGIFFKRQQTRIDADYNGDEASKDLQSNKILVAHIDSGTHIDFAEAYLNNIDFGYHLRKKNRGFEFASEMPNRHMS